MTSELPFDVFLSHSSDDKPVVGDIAERLREIGVRVWYDEWEIEVGDSIPSKINEGLQNSRSLALFMSESSLKKDWVELEAQTIRFTSPMNRNGRFIPVRMDDVVVPDGIAHFKRIEWKPDTSRAFDLLVRAIQRASGTGRQGIPSTEADAPPPTHAPEFDVVRQVDTPPEEVSPLDDKRRKILNTLWTKQVNRNFWPKKWWFRMSKEVQRQYQESVDALIASRLINYSAGRRITLTQYGWDYCKGHWRELGSDMWWPEHSINEENLRRVLGDTNGV